MENPYANGVMVTNSGIKSDLAMGFRIPVIASPGHILKVASAEARFDQENGNGMIVPTSTLFPYDVQIAHEKALGIVDDLPKTGISHLVTDSVYIVQLSNGEMVALNKPTRPHHAGKLINFYQQHPNDEVFSNTGIAKIGPDGKIKLFRAILALGVINPDLDPYKLMNILSANPHTSSGITTLEGFENGLFIPHDFLHFSLVEYQPNGRKLVAGSLLPRDGLKHYLSADSANNSWMRAFSLGIIPS